jgi:hypothetical protein
MTIAWAPSENDHADNAGSRNCFRASFQDMEREEAFGSIA